MYTSSSCNSSARETDSDYAPLRPRLASGHMVMARSRSLRHDIKTHNICVCRSPGWCVRTKIVGIWSMLDVFVPSYETICHVYKHVKLKATFVALMTCDVALCLGLLVINSRVRALIHEFMCLIWANLLHGTCRCCVCNWIVLWSNPHIFWCCSA